MSLNIHNNGLFNNIYKIKHVERQMIIDAFLFTITIILTIHELKATGINWVYV